MRTTRPLFVALLTSVFLALPPCSFAATLAVVAMDDGTLVLYPLSKNLGVPLPGKSIPVGRLPIGLCGNADGTRLYVSAVTEKKVAVVDVAAALADPAKGVIATLDEPGVQRASGCVVSPDSKKLYLLDAVGNAVFVYDTQSNQLHKKISVGEEPNRGIFSPDGKRLIVANAKSNTLSVIDPSTESVVQTVKTGQEPTAMTYTRDGKFLIVSLIDDDSIAFFKADTLEFDQQVGVSQSPQQLITSPNGHFLYSLGRWDGIVSVVNLRTRGEKRRVVASIHVPRYPTGMAMSPDGNHLYVSTNTYDSSVVHIDTEVLNVDFMLSAHRPGEMVYINDTASGTAGMSGASRVDHYRSLAQQAMDAVKKNDMATAARICQTLEREWDDSESALHQNSPVIWRQIDQAMDDFIHPITLSGGTAPNAAVLNAAYQNFLTKLNLI